MIKKAKVFHFDSYGKREEKYKKLNNTDFKNVDWKELELKEPYYFFVPKDFEAEEEYNKGFSVDAIFNINSSWITTSRDSFVIDDKVEALEKRVHDFIDLDEKELFIKYWLKNSREFSILSSKQIIKKVDLNKIKNIEYRIFDNKKIYYDINLIDWSRKKCMQHMLQENIWLITMRQFVENNWFNHIFVSKNLIDNRTFSSSRWTAYFFPLYLYQENEENLLSEWQENEKIKTPNLNWEIILKIEEKLKIPFVFSPDNNYTDVKWDFFTPENLLDYIYAILHSQSYREKYREFLKIDFPKIPFECSAKKFFTLAKLWEKLRKLHLMEDDFLQAKNFITKYEIDWENKVEKIKFEEWKVFINENQYFDWVPKKVWEFYIWWYNPAQKWLKDRKWKKLNYEDIIHYSKIILVLNETIKIMEKIEKC